MKNTTHDWYAIQVIEDCNFFLKGLTPLQILNILSPYGGTLSQVVYYVETNPSNQQLTWVPAEWIEENIFNNITY